MARITHRRRVVRIDGGQVRTREDRLIAEEPLAIRLGGTDLTVTMRTPGSDVELVQGFLLAEGLIRDRDDVDVIRYCAGVDDEGRNTFNVLDATLRTVSPLAAERARRNFLTSSSCGVCGKATLDAIEATSAYSPGDDPMTVGADVLSALPDRLRDQQDAFDQTGGLHAAGIFDTAGTPLVVREDVGRHNAVDKAVGWLVESSRLPALGTILMVSGRASFELVQKAYMAGIPVLAAVSAPSSLAVDLAERCGITLIGFLRGDSMNVYTHPHRVISAEPAASDDPAE